MKEKQSPLNNELVGTYRVVTDSDTFRVQECTKNARGFWFWKRDEIKWEFLGDNRFAGKEVPIRYFAVWDFDTKEDALKKIAELESKDQRKAHGWQQVYP